MLAFVVLVRKVRKRIESLNDENHIAKNLLRCFEFIVK